MYDGNASVVRAIAQGEIDVGLTDSDDAWAAKRNGWAVESVFEARDDEIEEIRKRGAELASEGPLLMPNTVSLVRGGPNAAGGLKLVEFLLSPNVERALAASDSRNVPVNAQVADEFPDLRVRDAALPDWARIESATEGATGLCQDALPG